MQKKILSFFLCLVTILTTVSTAFAVTPASAATPTVTVKYEGEEITSITVPQNEKKTIAASCDYVDGAEFQWQILADIKSDLWVNIYEETNAELALSYPLLSNMLDKANGAYVRASVLIGSEKLYSKPVYATIDNNLLTSAISAKPKQARAAKSSAKPYAEDEGTEVEYIYSRINYLEYDSKQPIYGTYTTKTIKGTAFSQKVLSPSWLGFAPYWNPDEPDTMDADSADTPATVITIQMTENDTKDTEINVFYKPVKVTYTARFYYQNIYDDFYTEDSSRYYRGEELAGNPVGDEELDSHGQKEGFVPLYHFPEEVAPDGSTVFECYYDRLYYLVSFDLGGGWGTEPVYARYGTAFIVPEPTLTGHSFQGWDEITEDYPNGDNISDTDNMPKTIPAKNLYYKAMWDISTVKIMYAFWLQNANDETKYDYYQSYTEEPSITDFFPDYVVSADEARYDELVNKKDANNQLVNPELQYFHFAKADENVKLSPAGTTLVNIYADRNTYNLRFIFAAETLDGQSGYFAKSLGGSLTGDYVTDFAGDKGQKPVPTDERWQNFVAGAKSFQDDNSKRKYYYFEINDIRYEQSLIDKWPSQGPYPADENGNPPRLDYLSTDKDEYYFCESMPQTDTPYTSKVGIKGPYENLSKDIISASAAERNNTTNLVVALSAYSGGNRYEVYCYFEKPDGTMPTVPDEPDIWYKAIIDTPGQERPNDFEGFEKAVINNGASSGSMLVYEFRRKSYKIEFVNNGKLLDDGVWANAVEKYQAPLDKYLGDEYIPPYPEIEENAYEFGGWYYTPDCVPDTEFKEGATMPAENIVLYAKWTPITHKVNFYYTEDDMNNGADPIEHQDVPHRSYVQHVDIPTHDEFKFVAWYYYDKGEKKRFIETDIPIIKDLDIFAEWGGEKAYPYMVHYVRKDNPDIKVADDFYNYAGMGSPHPVYPKFGQPKNELYDDYNMHWFPDVDESGKSINIQPVEDIYNPVENQATFYYIYLDHVHYTVEYRDAETGELMGDILGAGNQFENGTYNDNAGNTVPYGGVSIATKQTEYGMISERFVPIPGYLPDRYSKQIILSANDAANRIVFYYSKNDKDAKMYNVHYMTQNLGTTGENKNLPYEPGDYTEYGIGTVGYADKDQETIFYSPMEIDGYTDENFATQVIHREPEDRTAGHTKTTVEGLEGYEIRTAFEGTDFYIYLKRNMYKYRVEYRHAETDELMSDVLNDKAYAPKEGEMMFEDILRETAIDIPGYNCKPPTSSEIKILTNEEANVIIFYYLPLTYNIKYEVWSGGGGEVDRPFDSIIPNDPDFGVPVGSVPTANDGYIFEGWYLDPECTKPVNTDWVDGENRITPDMNEIEPFPADNIFYAKFTKMLSGLIIDRNNVDDEGNGDQIFVYHVENVTTGEVITVTVTGNGQTAITDLLEGEYIVTQDNDWSWRYQDGEKSVTVTPDETAVVTFDKSAEKFYGLNGNSGVKKNVKGNTGGTD